MKQVLQHARSGGISVVEVPAPKLLAGCLLVRIAASLVSAGTERASSEFASKNLLQKAQARPDLVRDVVGKVRRDGLLSTIATVRSRLDQPRALGYSSAGIVIAVGDGITDINVGDRVACAGAGYAVHAEFACIPRLLAAKLPGANVGFDEAAFSTVGAVTLHGIRTGDVGLGDMVAVIGLGLLGQLTVQSLKSAGCRVIGLDLKQERVDLALQLGADFASTSNATFGEMCFEHSRGHGADVVLITAETASSDPVNLAARVARDRAVVVAVGTVGLDLERKLYYEKELDFRIPRSYGPGRYDAAYEQKGRDYPIGYVRWTETRNMDAFLQLLAEGKLDLKPLITHRFPIEQAKNAYELITGKTGEPFLGVLITYSDESEPDRRLELVSHAGMAARSPQTSAAIGLLGAGSFATSTLLPAMKHVEGVDLTGICAANGSHARHAAEKFGFRYCATDEEQILRDPKVNTVVIATRHHLHAAQVLAALRAGKNVFCEKPLCLTQDELLEIEQVARQASESGQLLMVGFNRRFAPLAVRMKAFLMQSAEPLAMHYLVNAGFIPADHWVNDPDQGGGRILGEACHFVDFLSFLAGSDPVEVQTRSLANHGRYSEDNVILSLQYANGSQGTVSYLANGDKLFSKERIEVFGGAGVAVLQDFRTLEMVRHGKRQILRSRLRQDKGYRGEWEALATAIRNGGDPPIPLNRIMTSTWATLKAVESRASGKAIAIDVSPFVERRLHRSDH